MDTEQLEKQYQFWNRFMYMILGALITLLIISFGNMVIYRNTWPNFDNYTGGVWTFMEFLAVVPGLYLLWNRPWKTFPLATRLNTALGYFIAGWIGLVALAFIIDPNYAPDELIFIIIGSAIVIALGYIWALKKTATPRDEMFP